MTCIANLKCHCDGVLLMRIAVAHAIPVGGACVQESRRS